METPAPTPRFRRGDNIEALLESHPGVADVLASFGLKCVDCIVAPTETLEEGCRPLGVDVDAVLAALNALPAVSA